MKVLYLVNTPFQGRASTTVATEGWFRHLRPKGLEPVVACSYATEFYSWSHERGIPTYHVPLPTPSKVWPWPFLRSLWRLRKIVKRHGIQLIHCNEHEIYPVGQYLARWCRLPVVVSVHFTMGRPFCEWLFGGKKQPQRVFFLSKGSLDACQPGIQGIVPEANWRLLYNGLDLEHFKPDSSRSIAFKKQHRMNGEVLIGVACALRPRKQLEHFVEAIARVKSPNLRILLAGGPVPGDETYAANLLETAKQKLGDRLVCLGHLSELRGFYNALDLFINTSQEEACSISIMESLACGCPVVGYPSTSVDEQVLPGGGEIVEQDNIQELTTVLDRWVSDSNNLKAARPRARQRAEEVFDIRKISGQLWSEYQSLLEPHFTDRNSEKTAVMQSNKSFA
jgi:glycosyltransferase involved in cell wall biosynthesis